MQPECNEHRAKEGDATTVESQRSNGGSPDWRFTDDLEPVRRPSKVSIPRVAPWIEEWDSATGGWVVAIDAGVLRAACIISKWVDAFRPFVSE